jgi:hypothetical protein
MFASSGPYDHTGGLVAPLEIGTGGYMLVFKVPNNGTGWEDVTTYNALQAKAPGQQQEEKKILLCGRAQMIKNKEALLPQSVNHGKNLGMNWKKANTIVPQ